MIPTLACMGGWCARRDGCARYWHQTTEERTVERFCDKAKDEPIPVAVVWKQKESA